MHISLAILAVSGKYSEISIPDTAVGMALVSPPLAWPGLGENVSNWLGPPFIHSRMQRLAPPAQTRLLSGHQVSPTQCASCQTGRGYRSQELATIADVAAAKLDVGLTIETCEHDSFL